MTSQHTLLLATLLFVLSAASLSAKADCPFTEDFYLSGPVGTQVLHAKTTKNLKITQQSDNHFSLSCADDRSKKDGTLTLTVGIDENNACQLSIVDGPYVWEVQIVPTQCTGDFQYDGTDKPGYYAYSLNFSTPKYWLTP